MKVSIIDTGLFKLDGGAMFGVVPKSMWQNINVPDENNMCTWTMRCLLVEDGERKILIDTGLGNKQDEKFRSHFYPHGEGDLIQSVLSSGLNVEEVTDVILTHFHFDHVGGAVRKDKDGNLLPTFPNATYWTNALHYDWAYQANPREKASFLKENFVPLKEQGILKNIDVEQGVSFSDSINIRFAYGHTEAMMMPEITLENGKKIIFAADLIPSYGHIGLPYVMSYDIRPLVTMEERAALYEYMEDGHYIFFEHDHVNQCASVKRNNRGRVVIDELLELKDII